jgi:phage terminase small subunit
MGTDIVISDIDDESLGPAMKRCTRLQRRFVLAILMIGGGQHMRAAAMAGYSGNANGLAQAGFRAAHTPYVQAAILEEAAKRLGGSAIEAVNVVLEQLTDPKASHKDRRAAAQMILDRVGLHAKTEHNIAVTHDVGTNTMMLEMIRQRLKNNPDFINSVPAPIRLLLDAENKPTINAEFAEIDPELNALLEIEAWTKEIE